MDSVTASSTVSPDRSTTTAMSMANKVPVVTAFFWIIKVLCTTVGETAADYLNVDLNFGLTATSLVMGALLLVVLAVQLNLKRYVPVVYWLAVVLISIVGTLITDNLTDHFGVSLVTSSVVFAIILFIVMMIWLRVEGTISIHTITTKRRECFYWLTVLFTFALGTATGDLVAEQWNLGYRSSLLLFLAIIAVIGVAYKQWGLDATMAFWFTYILTRPLGASLGDYLSQSPDDGGLGLGTVATSVIFLGTITALVIYLTATRRDVEPDGPALAA